MLQVRKSKWFTLEDNIDPSFYGEKAVFELEWDIMGS